MVHVTHSSPLSQSTLKDNRPITNQCCQCFDFLFNSSDEDKPEEVEETAGEATGQTETIPESPLKDDLIASLEAQLRLKEDECRTLQTQLKIEYFCINRFLNDHTLISFYTGFSSYNLFIAFYKCIDPTANNMQSVYY